MKHQKMKAIKKVLPERLTEDSTPGTLHGPNDYQYYREYDNGWELSIVCNYAVFDYEKGYFEVAVKSNTSTEWIIVSRCYGFRDTADFIDEFENDPKQAVTTRSIEIENGI